MSPEDESTGGSSETCDGAERQGRQLMRAHDATWALWAVLRTADDAEHTVAREMGLPYTDALALDHVLSSAKPLGPVELGRRLGISPASATVLVDRLVASGNLTRRSDPADGRRRVLTATEQARRNAVDAMAPLLHELDALAAQLTDDAAATVISYLRDVAAVQRKHSGSTDRGAYTGND